MTADPQNASPVSTARVETDRPGRYGKQLASHFAKRLQTSWDEESGRGALTFPVGPVALEAHDGALVLAIVDVPAEEVERIENVVGGHLVRFGARDELVVEWVRADGTPGTSQTNPDEDGE